MLLTYLLNARMHSGSFWFAGCRQRRNAQVLSRKFAEKLHSESMRFCEREVVCSMSSRKRCGVVIVSNWSSWPHEWRKGRFNPSASLLVGLHRSLSACRFLRVFTSVPKWSIFVNFRNRVAFCVLSIPKFCRFFCFKGFKV